jgi:hypothetical protein
MKNEFVSPPNSKPKYMNDLSDSNLPLKGVDIARILRICRSTAYQLIRRNEITTDHVWKSVRVKYLTLIISLTNLDTQIVKSKT